MEDSRLGRVFGRLTIAEFVGCNKSRSKLYRCVCSCGGGTTVTFNALVIGHTKSCGCLNREIITRHGGSYTVEYGAWHALWARCTNPKSRGYRRYGGRGIAVDPAWKDFANFLADMGPRPGPGYSLDRKQNDLGYSKDNCRWATAEEQNNNQERNTNLTYLGRTMSIARWARETGISDSTIRARLGRGWSTEQTLGVPTGAVPGGRGGGLNGGNTKWRK